MLDKIDYTSSFGESITLRPDLPIYVTDDALRTFTWNHTDIANKVKTFTRGVTEKTLPIVVPCGDADRATQASEHIYKVCERDTMSNNFGRLYVGEYYLPCSVIGHSSAECKASGLLELTLEIVSGHPFWTREVKRSFLPDAVQAQNTGQDLDYPHDYPYDYASDRWSANVFNDSVGECNFLLTFYGPCVDPFVVIDNHVYQVFITLTDASEKCEVDSRFKTVKKIDFKGNEENVFNKRSTESYLFRKIQPGVNIVNKESTYGVDVVLFDERSEPKW